MILIVQQIECSAGCNGYGCCLDRQSDAKNAEWPYEILFACENFNEVREYLDIVERENKISGDLEWQIWRPGDKGPFKSGRIRKAEVKTYKYTIDDNPKMTAQDYDRNSHRPWEDQ